MPELEIIERQDGSLLIAGSAAQTDRVMQRLGLPVPERRDYQTAAGYVLDKFGRLPVVGDSLEDRGYRFEIVDMDGRRIDKLLVSRASLPTRRAVRFV